MFGRNTSSTSPTTNSEVRRPPDVEAGRMIGAFRIEGLLGKGGMGAVYRATDTTLDRLVALKLLSPSLAERSDALVRFEQEAKSASWVNHDNIVQILSYGIEDGVPYIAMEYLRGETLAARIRKGPMSVQAACDVALPLCSGLHAAHQQGILHRDLKPSNVILATKPTGETPKLLDFGISKLATGDTVNLTDTGVVLGTERYMAPEQAAGNALDGRADQFSLGVVLYECITGRHPHEGKAQFKIFSDAALGLFDRPSTFVPDLPSELETLIVRLMSPDPEQRFADMRAVGRALLPYTSTRIRSLWTEHYIAQEAGATIAPALSQDGEAPTTDVMGKTSLDRAIGRSETDFKSGPATESEKAGATVVFEAENAEPLPPTRTMAYVANPESDATAIQPVRRGSLRRSILAVGVVIAVTLLGWFTLRREHVEPHPTIQTKPARTPVTVPALPPIPPVPVAPETIAPAAEKETTSAPPKARKKARPGKIYYTPEGVPVI